MKSQVEVPAVGESVSKGVLSAWLKQAGDYVKEGEELFELETDKATMSVPAKTSGVLEIVVAADSEVEVGQVVARIDTENEGRRTAEPQSRPEPETPERGEQAAPQRQVQPAPQQQREPQPQRQAEPGLSPAVRRLVDEHGLDPATIEGSGRDGRITKEDVLARLERKDRQQRPEGAPPAPPTAAQPEPARPEPAPPEPVQPEPAQPEPARPLPVSGRSQVRKRMSPLRRTVAEHLVASRQAAAHLTTFNEVDMSRVMEMRAAYRESFEKRHGVRLGFMSFFVKASVRALQEWPEVNAFIEGDQIVYNSFYDIGVAVSTERGLVVPVIRDAGSKGFADLEKEIADVALRARDRRLGVDEMSGGTFTITNGGVFGSLLSTPIPNPPQTAVLGMHAIQKRPVVVGEQIVARPMMYLALTYDHRLIDGRQAVSFVGRVKALIEDPNQLLLDL